MVYQDEDLLSYLKGTASERLAQAIEEDMARDAALEDRIMALDPLNAPVRSAFAKVETPDADTFVSIEPPRNPIVGFPLRAAALVAAGVLAGVLGLSVLNDSNAAPSWQTQVANYQALYGHDTVAGPQRPSAERLAQTELAGARIGLENLVQTLEATPDLTHVRTQILQVNGVPLAQIVFRTSDGTPVALCGLPLAEGATPQDLQMSDMDEMASATFQTGNHSWLLIGTDDPELISKSARTFQSVLRDL